MSSIDAAEILVKIESRYFEAVAAESAAKKELARAKKDRLALKKQCQKIYAIKAALSKELQK